MRITRRSTMAVFAATAALSVGMSEPAAAAPVQEGLVNVNVSGVDIAVPVSVAANICDVSANVLAAQGDVGDTVCTATAQSIATPGRGGDRGGAPRQEGLVNVNISDLTVQLPVAIAANVCDLDVNVLAQQIDAGRTTCDAAADSEA